MAGCAVPPAVDFGRCAKAGDSVMLRSDVAITHPINMRRPRAMRTRITLRQHRGEGNVFGAFPCQRALGGGRAVAMAKARASWDEYFMNIAKEVSSRATCDRKHVGAVIVRDKSILATGYNGSVRGL